MIFCNKIWMSVTGCHYEKNFNLPPTEFLNRNKVRVGANSKTRKLNLWLKGFRKIVWNHFFTFQNWYLSHTLAVGLCEDNEPHNRFLGDCIQKFLKNISLSWKILFSKTDFQFFTHCWGFTRFPHLMKLSNTLSSL